LGRANIYGKFLSKAKKKITQNSKKVKSRGDRAM
jgi:hypothetical protein